MFAYLDFRTIVAISTSKALAALRLLPCKRIISLTNSLSYCVTSARNDECFVVISLMEYNGASGLDAKVFRTNSLWIATSLAYSGR